MNRTFLVLVLLALQANLTPGQQSCFVQVSLDARTATTTNPVRVVGLPAGTYRVTYEGGAWSPWSSVAGSRGAPDWRVGDFTVALNGGSWSIPRGYATFSASSSEAAALAAIMPVSLTHTGGDALVWITDDPYTDNRGGMRIGLERVPDPHVAPHGPCAGGGDFEVGLTLSVVPPPFPRISGIANGPPGSPVSIWASNTVQTAFREDAQICVGSHIGSGGGTLAIALTSASARFDANGQYAFTVNLPPCLAGETWYVQATSMDDSTSVSWGVSLQATIDFLARSLGLGAEGYYDFNGTRVIGVSPAWRLDL